MVEMQHVIGERLAGAVGKDTPPLAQQSWRKLRAGRLQVTLHTDFHLPRRTQTRWVHDRAPHARGRCSLPDRAHVIPSRPMATLAIDAFGQALRKGACAVPEVRSGFDLRIAVVAKHATIRHFAAETRMIRTVVRGAHTPVAALFGVPRQGKLDQSSGRGAMQIAAGVVSRSEYI